MTDIKPVIMSVSFTYTPEEYLEYCKREEIEPSQEDFEEFILEWFNDDINYPEDGKFETKRIEE